MATPSTGQGAPLVSLYHAGLTVYPARVKESFE